MAFPKNEQTARRDAHRSRTMNNRRADTGTVLASVYVIPSENCACEGFASHLAPLRDPEESCYGQEQDDHRGVPRPGERAVGVRLAAVSRLHVVRNQRDD